MRSRIATRCCQAKHAKCRVLQAMRVLLPSISAKPTSHSPVSSRHAQGPFGKQVSQAKEWTKAHCHILLLFRTTTSLVDAGDARCSGGLPVGVGIDASDCFGIVAGTLDDSCRLPEQTTLLDQASASFRGTLCRTGCSALITGHVKLYQALHDTSLQQLAIAGCAANGSSPVYTPIAIASFRFIQPPLKHHIRSIQCKLFGKFLQASHENVGVHYCFSKSFIEGVQ